MVVGTVLELQRLRRVKKLLSAAARQALALRRDRQRRQAWPRRIAQHVRALLGRVRQLDQADQAWGRGVGLGPGMRTSTHLIFREGQLSIFHVTIFQTVKIISIGVQLQDLAFEIPIWQD